MPGFLDVIHQIVDGTPVDAATTNVPLADLQNNVLYLKNLLLASTGSQALYLRSVPLNPVLMTGQPVYYNGSAGYYDLALADSSVKENVAGLVASKASPNVGDIVTLGYIALSLANALPVGSPTPDAPGRYYLSPTTPGMLTGTQPVPSVIVCMADGIGNLIVAPQVHDMPGPVGPQGHVGTKGYQGNRGNQGVRGPQGTPPTQPQLVSMTGTTASTLTTALSLSGPNGILGVVSIRNTGANSLNYQVGVTNAFGNSSTALTDTVPAGNGVSFALEGLLGSALPPFTVFTLSVQDQSAGLHTTYSVKGSVSK